MCGSCNHLHTHFFSLSWYCTNRLSILNSSLPAQLPINNIVMRSSRHGQDRRQSYQPTLVHSRPDVAYNSTRIPDYSGTSTARPTTVPGSSNSTRRNQPHITEYNRTGSVRSVCRCANPRSHGDAFTRQNPPRGRMLDIHGQPLTWEEAMHRELDAAGKDKINSQEQLAVLDRVYHPEYAALVRRDARLAMSPAANRLQFCLESNVIWHGRVNPRGLPIRRVEDIRPEVGPGLATRYERYGTISSRPGGRR